jgi:ubiquitin-conjugating enzyme E2 H
MRSLLMIAPFDGGVWKVHVELPDQYPYKSPSIGFVNRIFHPNIDEVYFTPPTLTKADSPQKRFRVFRRHQSNLVTHVRYHHPSFSPPPTSLTLVDMINIFEVFLPQLLRYPNPADPLNGDAAVLLLREPKSYEAKVRDYVSRYATKEAVEEMDNSEDSEYEMSDAEMSDDDEDEPAGAMELS